MCGNIKFISSVDEDIQAKPTSEITLSTQEINFIFPSIHLLFCLLYKKLSRYPQNSIKTQR